MLSVDGSSWIGIVLAIIGVTVALGLLLRYRRLEREGTPLPPGAGGARLVGVVATMVEDHDPRGRAGTVRVLGDDWVLADAVVVPLTAGQPVRVTEVVGTRLIVAPVDDEAAAAGPPTDA